MSDAGDAYLTVDDLADLLKCSPKTVARWSLTDPTMPVLRVGRVVRFPKARLLRWLASREQGRGRPRLAVIARKSAGADLDA
jgi:excisionase family DNA binding protein